MRRDTHPEELRRLGESIFGNGFDKVFVGDVESASKEQKEQRANTAAAENEKGHAPRGTGSERRRL
jgi:hypothetical protein